MTDVYPAAAQRRERLVEGYGADPVEHQPSSASWASAQSDGVP
jgi:hypothetical protein